jgi:hypothetical protein
MDVEGKGRVCTRKEAKAHSKMRRRDCLARAVDLELPLLQPWQHETLRPVALRPRHTKRCRGLSSLTVRSRTAKQGPRADPGVLHKGFGSFRRPFARLPRGGDPGLAGRRPERGTTGTNNRQQDITYGSSPLMARESRIGWSHQRRKEGFHSTSVNRTTP